jgi:hypothetical protein
MDKVHKVNDCNSEISSSVSCKIKPVVVFQLPSDTKEKVQSVVFERTRTVLCLTTRL